MNWLEETRKKYRIQQEMLAVYLGITRTTLSMAEIDQRQLPIGNMVRLDPLLTEEETVLSGRFAEILQQAEAKSTDDLTKRAVRKKLQLQVKLNRANARLKDMQQKYKQATDALKLAQRIDALPVNSEETKRRRILREWLEAKAAVWLEDNGAAAQAPLEESIHIYEILLAAE